MAKEKIENVSRQILLKRKRFFIVIRGIYIGIFIFFIALFVYELIKDGRIEKSSLTGLVPVFGTFWIPFLFIGEINKELRRRDEPESGN